MSYNANPANYACVDHRRVGCEECGFAQSALDWLIPLSLPKGYNVDGEACSAHDVPDCSECYKLGIRSERHKNHGVLVSGGMFEKGTMQCIPGGIGHSDWSRDLSVGDDIPDLAAWIGRIPQYVINVSDVAKKVKLVNSLIQFGGHKVTHKAYELTIPVLLDESDQLGDPDNRYDGLQEILNSLNSSTWAFEAESDESDVLNELGASVKSPQGFEVWQGVHMVWDDTTRTYVPTLHNMPGGRNPGQKDPKPRLVHYAWCEAPVSRMSASERIARIMASDPNEAMVSDKYRIVQVRDEKGNIVRSERKCAERHTCRKGAHSDWMCPLHGSDHVRGKSVESLTDDGLAAVWSEDANPRSERQMSAYVPPVRGETIRVGKRGSWLLPHKGKRGQSVRPRPTSSVMSPGKWTDRTNAAILLNVEVEAETGETVIKRMVAAKKVLVLNKAGKVLSIHNATPVEQPADKHHSEEWSKTVEISRMPNKATIALLAAMNPDVLRWLKERFPDKADNAEVSPRRRTYTQKRTDEEKRLDMLEWVQSQMEESTSDTTLKAALTADRAEADEQIELVMSLAQDKVTGPVNRSRLPRKGRQSL